MERGVKIMVNCIRCKQCGETLNSRYTHDFIPCECFIKSDGREGCACDGGLEYLRRVGDVNTWEDLSVTRPYTDEEVDEYNKKAEEHAAQFGWTPVYMEK